MFFLAINSCRKEINPSSADTDLVNRPTRTNTVLPDDINNWFNSYPQLKPAAVLLNAAQQATINNRQVVRIPIATNAALYFTKVNGVLNVYAYRWIYNEPVTSNYTGTIAIYNFQNQQLVSNVYENNKLVKYAILANNKSIVSTGNNKLKVNTFDLLGQIWCFLTLGTWISEDDIDAGRSAGANGEVGKVGCDYSASNDGVDVDDDYPTVVYYYITDSSSDPIYVSTDGGGGSDWGPPPCPPPSQSPNNTLSAKLKTNQLAPGDPGDGGSGDGSGCGISTPDQGQWVPYVISIDEPTNTDNVMSSDDVDTDDDNNPDGNFDNTDYPEYQQTTPWPAITNVLAGKPYVKYNHTNCLTLAKQQIATLGYSISNYGAPGQTIQVYTEASGANQSNVKKAVTYINSQLSKGAPVIVGVDSKPGQSSSPYTDNSTDHFIVITGSGTDNGGNYYQFYDNSTDNSLYGTSVNNKLYYNSNTGIISGNTHTLYDSPATQLTNPILHPYIVTQIRKNKD